ncbi:MAG: MarR family winged helix-turn-helix transcriptional regulator [Dehalobacterium sp.]|jgi:MarR family 2-MHQ and catechol resistance regulon transcriptional repressor
MDENISKKLPAYWWVDTTAGKVVLNMGDALGFIENIYDQFLSRWGLSQTKANVLLLLYKNEALALWELGEKLLVSRANITGLMDRLSKSGLVTREINPLDRRSLIAKLTPKGKMLIEEIIPLLKDFTEKVFSPLSETEQEQLIKLLQKIQYNQK